MERIEVDPGALTAVAGQLSAGVEVARRVKEHHGRMAGTLERTGHPLMQLALATYLDRWSYGCGCLVSDAETIAGGIESLVDGRDGRQLIEIGEGMAAGIKDMATGLWTLTGTVLTDPHKFARAWTGLALTMYTLQGRLRFAKSFVDFDEWSTNPARALGRATVSIAGPFVGGEGVAAKLGNATAGRDSALRMDRSRCDRRRLLRETTQQTAETKPAQPLGNRSCLRASRR